MGPHVMNIALWDICLWVSEDIKTPQNHSYLIPPHKADSMYTLPKKHMCMGEHLIHIALWGMSLIGDEGIKTPKKSYPVLPQRHNL